MQQICSTFIRMYVCKAILRSVLVNVVAEEKQELIHILSVFVVSVTQNAKRMHPIISSSVARLALQNFYTLPHKRHRHGKCRRYRDSLQAAVRRSNTSEVEIFCTNPDRPWGPPSLLCNGYRMSFPGIKRPGRGVDHPPTPSAEGRESAEVYLYYPSGPSCPALRQTLPLPHKRQHFQGKMLCFDFLYKFSLKHFSF
jgi:hypothetical protein